MSGETTTITSVNVAERSQSQQAGELAAPENLVTRMMGRASAVLNHMNGFPMVTLEKPVRTVEEQQEIDDLEEAFNQPSYTPDHERQTGRFGRLRSKLGMVAARASLKLYELQTGTSSDGTSRIGRLFEKHEAYRQKFEANEDDTNRTRVRKFLARNALELAAGTVAAGALSTKFYLATKGMDWGESWKRPRTVTMGVDMAANSIDLMPVQTSFKSISIMTPGHWDGSAQGMYEAMQRQGAINNQSVVIKNQYSAEMANPFMPGDVQTTEESIAPAVRKIVDMYNQTPKDMMFTSSAFSEGGMAANRAAWEIINANGGVKPDNFQSVIYGGSMGPTSIQNNAFVNLVKPIANIYAPLYEKPAPGTVFITNQNDIIGNGANQTGLASLLMTADFAHAHNLDVEAGNQNYTAVVYGDEGVITKIVGNVHPIAEMLDKNNGIKVTPTVNRVLQDIIPINNNGSGTVPRPNAHDAIAAVGEQIGHDVGNPMGAAMVAGNVNAQYGDQAQHLAEVANNLPNQLAAGDFAGASQTFNQGVQSVGELLDPNKAMNLAKDTINGAIDQGADNFIAPEQRAAAQPWLDMGKKVVSDLFTPKPNTAPAPAPQPISPELQPWVDAGTQLLDSLFKPKQ